ncbi:hypothetical protein [Klebsiella pneumoniae]
MEYLCWEWYGIDLGKNATFHRNNLYWDWYYDAEKMSHIPGKMRAIKKTAVDGRRVILEGPTAKWFRVTLPVSQLTAQVGYSEWSFHQYGCDS